jgi:hypothetical protein
MAADAAKWNDYICIPEGCIDMAAVKQRGKQTAERSGRCSAFQSTHSSQGKPV